MKYSIDSCCWNHKNGVWDFNLTFFLSNETLWIREGRRNKMWIIRVSILFFIRKKNSASSEERIRQDWEKEEKKKCWSLWWVQFYPDYIYNWLRKKRNGEIVMTWVAKKVKYLWFCQIPGNHPHFRPGKWFKIDVEKHIGVGEVSVTMVTKLATSTLGKSST